MENTTAKVSCFARAYHYKNNKIHVFADDRAEKILGDEYDQIAESMMQGINFFMPGFEGAREEGLRLIVDRQLSPSVLGRSVFCEGMLKDMVSQGCRQYLIFAAGYDTYALRNDDPSLSVYELDMPDLIKDKAERINKAGLVSNAHAVACDLAEEGWSEKLKQKGFLPGERSFGSLLGISYYLERSEWKRLIDSVAEIMPAGSAICFDHPSDDESKETKTNQQLAQGAGEMMKAVYRDEEMKTILGDAGFEIVRCLDSRAMTDRYFAEYNKDTPEHQMAAPYGVKYVFAVKGE